MLTKTKPAIPNLTLVMPVFFGVRKEITKITEFEYGYKNCRTNFNKLKNLMTITYIQDCYIK